MQGNNYLDSEKVMIIVIKCSEDQLLLAALKTLLYCKQSNVSRRQN